MNGIEMHKGQTVQTFIYIIQTKIKYHFTMSNMTYFSCEQGISWCMSDHQLTKFTIFVALVIDNNPASPSKNVSPYIVEDTEGTCCNYEYSPLPSRESDTIVVNQIKPIIVSMTSRHFCEPFWCWMAYVDSILYVFLFYRMKEEVIYIEWGL